MTWWHAKDHPLWTCLQMALGIVGLAYLGADSLDVKDLASVAGGAGLGFLKGRRG